MRTGASKYRAKPTVIDGIRFASKRESERYVGLKAMQEAGLIFNLCLQPKYPLVVNGQKVCTYVADFRYVVKDGGEVVEDSKVQATKTPVYRLKFKLMQALYGISISEV